MVAEDVREVKLRKTFMTAAALCVFAVVASFAALSVASYVAHAWRSDANVPQLAPVTEPAAAPAAAPVASENQQGIPPLPVQEE